MSITTKNIEDPYCLLLMKIAEIFNIKKLRLKYYESIFEIISDGRIVGVINYVFVPSMRKNRIYIRNIYYNDTEYLDIIIKESCKFFKNYMIESDINENQITKDCEIIMQQNNFKGDNNIFYE